MNDDKLGITLKIAGKTYPMSINPQMEEIYRLAEREVNRRFVESQRNRTDGYAVQDYLASVAVELAVSNIRLSQSREVGSDDLKRLAGLAKEVETHLDK